jgi:hypothetical protein
VEPDNAGREAFCDLQVNRRENGAILIAAMLFLIGVAALVIAHGQDWFFFDPSNFGSHK